MKPLHVPGQVEGRRAHVVTNLTGKTCLCQVRKLVALKVAGEGKGATAKVAPELIFAPSVALHVSLEVSHMGEGFLAYSALKQSQI